MEIIEADARHTGLAADSFDLVYARLLLVTIPDPADVVTEIVRLMKPGGWATDEGADATTHVCYPSHPAWDRLVDVFVAAFRQDGADPQIGRRVPELLWQGGLTDVGLEAWADVFPVGHSRRTVRLDILQAMRGKLIERELLTAEELDALDAAARRGP